MLNEVAGEWQVRGPFSFRASSTIAPVGAEVNSQGRKPLVQAHLFIFFRAFAPSIIACRWDQPFQRTIQPGW